MRLTSTAVCLTAAAASASAMLQVPLTLQKVRTDLAKMLRPGLAKAIAPIPETDDSGFWFANFDVGAGKGLSLLIDTGSADVYLNPGNVYTPGPDAVDEHRTFQISFATTNPDGTGAETLSGELWRDTVTLGELTVKNQELGNVTKSSVAQAFPHDGLVGFAGQASSAFGGVPFFAHACDQGLVKECRFGLAFGTNGQGVQTLGGVDAKHANSLSIAPITSQWATSMDVVVGGTTLEKRQPVQFDSGTTVIYGPTAMVKKVYQKLGLPTSVDGDYLHGYYPCDKPPMVGFNLGGKTFNIVPEAWPAKNNGNNNCTGTLQGTDGFGSLWLVGQAFFQGHYVDHNLDAGNMGFADL